MLKPKNINIKKVTDPQLKVQQKNHSTKRVNSRKSLRVPAKNVSSSKASPIEAMKKNTLEDQRCSSNQDSSDFIACINGYLNQLGSEKSRLREGGGEIEQIRLRLRKEKEINRRLQKNIINFQKILIERTQKIEKLEETVNKIQNKENCRSLANSQTKSRGKLSKKSSRPTALNYDAHSQYQFLQSEESQEFNFQKYRKRRRTQVPSDIELMISKTMGFRPNSKTQSKFL